MQFEALLIPGAWKIEVEPHVDERGSFARTYSADELRAHGVDPRVAEESLSSNTHRGTLRGMHLQREPFGEGKHVRCTRGRIFDVLVDLRPDSPTYRRWFGLELADGDGTTLFVPPGIAHGFLTLADGTQVEYRMTVPHEPSAASGVRWDDPAFGVIWPEQPRIMSERDATWPDHRP